MSLIPARAPKLAPEIRLAQAVSQFEADLSDEQKTTFRSYRSQALHTPPTSSDVMRLTAEIDCMASGKVGARCFGPRFTNFLQVIQQFAALGDVVVGGSQNIIACGVWSLVRMTFLLVGNFSSYLDKLSDLFMKVGRTAPRYQNMALLYPQSKQLQSHLSEYFLVVVRLCHRLLTFTQKSTIRQITSTLSDLDIRTSQSDLEHWANSIREEMSLLMAITIEKEAQESSRFRALLSKRSKVASHQRKLAINQRVLELCSKYDYETTWKQTRKVGNTTFFRHDPKYEDWKGEGNSCTLIYTGKLGSGKSVLLANILDDLYIHAQSKNVVIAYFFCRHDIMESLSSQTVIRSLAQQLLRTIPDLAALAEHFDKTRTVLDLDPILEFLRCNLPSGHKTYFILDGLDECDRSEREILAQQLHKLQETLTLLLCVSFRVEPDSPSELGSVRFTAAKTTSIPDSNPDIEAFIDAKLESCLKSRTLVIGEPTLILEIHDALLRGSQGMFLWVALQIQVLCAMDTDQAIRDALRDLPKDLSETFSRILQKSKGSSQSYRMRILQLIMVAFRPLTIDELREALSVVIGDAVWSSSKLLNNVYSTLACCGCLLIIDEEELTVRFVHNSVKQFLLYRSEDPTNIGFTTVSAQRTMADIIVTYLSYGIFGTQLSTMKASQMIIRSAPSSIIRSALGQSTHVQGLALKLLKSKNRSDFDMSKFLAKSREPQQSRQADEFHFYAYATVHWLQHVFYMSGQKLVIYNLLLKLVKEDILKGQAADEDVWTPLTWAAQNGNEAIVKVLIDSGKVNVNAKDARGQTPLSHAAANGHEEVVRLLVDRNDVKAHSRDINFQTPLSRAVENGHKEVVRLLVDRNDVNADSEAMNGQTPLSRAAEKGHKEVVRLLVDRNDVEVSSKDVYGQTPLSRAAEKGHEEVVKLLVDRNDVEVNSKHGYGQTPLSRAAERGHKEVVRLLIDRNDVEADSKDNTYSRTPLSWAAQEGHEEVVRLLVDHNDVEADSKDKHGQTPLSWAAFGGHEEVVRLLVDRNDVEVNSKDVNNQTPLSWAAWKGHKEVVKLLVDCNDVEVDFKDKYGQTPLSRAAKRGHKEVVRLLIDRNDVEADSKDKHGQTPLSWAAQEGHEEVVRLLVNRNDVEVNSKDVNNRTPLSWAAWEGREEVVKLLVDRNDVEVNSKDKHGQTPLSWAALGGHEEVVRLLVDRNDVEVNSKDVNNQTPLSWAAWKGHKEVVKLLVDCNDVEVNSKDKYGQTPLSRAAKRGHKEVVQLLSSHVQRI